MKLIILDRDGVINEDSDQYIKSPDEWIPIPGSLEAIARLNQAGYHITIATNQSGLARGLFNLEDLNAIHQKMHLALSRIGGQIDGIFFCPHGPDDGCSCRKPKPGLYQQIAIRCEATLNDVPIIGDSRRDLEAAIEVNAKPYLVRTGKGTKTEADIKDLDIPVFDTLWDAVSYILEEV